MVKRSKPSGVKPKPVLKKVINNVPLTEEDKEFLTKLIEGFKKAKKGKELDESEIKSINQLLEMRSLNLGSAQEYMRTCLNLLHLAEYFNNT